MKIRKVSKEGWILYAKILLGILAVFGVFLIIGAIGQADYTAEIREVYTVRQMLWRIFCGGIAIAPITIWLVIENRRWLD